MSVSNFHRRRWDEPRAPVEVPQDDGSCCGDLEARRTRGGQWEAWVRCTDVVGEAADTCSGWFEWSDVRVLDAGSPSRSRPDPGRCPGPSESAGR